MKVLVDVCMNLRRSYSKSKFTPNYVARVFGYGYSCTKRKLPNMVMSYSQFSTDQSINVSNIEVIKLAMCQNGEHDELVNVF
jgi:hypothetical protein